MTAAWRRSPPTADEVKACRYWWIRRDGCVQPAKVSYEYGFSVTTIDGWAHVLPAETEYAPCLPPDGGAR